MDVSFCPYLTLVLCFFEDKTFVVSSSPFFLLPEDMDWEASYSAVFTINIEDDEPDQKLQEMNQKREGLMEY